MKAFIYISKLSVLCGFFLLVVIQNSNAQENVDSTWKEKSFISRATSIPPFQSKPRLIGVTATYAAGWTGTLIALNEIWYKDFPRSKFKTFNDSKEWLQVDKVGHTYSAYRLGLG